MIRLLSVSMSCHRMNYVTNRCRRLSRRCTILATSLAVMRIEILKSSDQVHRYRRTSRSFCINQPAHYCTTHVTPSTMIPMTQVSPVMEWRSPPVPSDSGHKIRAKIDQVSKVRRKLIPTMPESVSPARRKNRHCSIPHIGSSQQGEI